MTVTRELEYNTFLATQQIELELNEVLMRHVLYGLAFTQINCLAVDLKRKQNRADLSFTASRNRGREKKSITDETLCPEQEPKASVYKSVS